LRRDDGLYSVRGVAKLLEITVARVHAWVAQRHLAPVEGGNGRPAWFRLKAQDVKRLRQLRASRVGRGYRFTARRRRRGG
jgi:hypothetical protein